MTSDKETVVISATQPQDEDTLAVKFPLKIAASNLLVKSVANDVASANDVSDNDVRTSKLTVAVPKSLRLEAKETNSNENRSSRLIPGILFAIPGKNFSAVTSAADVAVNPRVTATVTSS